MAPQLTWSRRLFERRPLLLLGTIFVLSLPVVTPYLRGDGIAYYAYLASAVIDGDLMFENEYKHSDPGRCARYFDEQGRPHANMWTATGHLENYHSAGPAFLWSPFFAVAHGGVKLRNALSPDAPPIPEDGYSRPYLLLCALGTALFGFGGLLFGHAVARAGVGTWAALWATLGLWFASNLPVYMYLLPFLSHPASALVNGAFVWYWWRTWRPPTTEEPLGRSPWQWLGLGALGGLMFAVYYVGAVIGVFVLFDALAAVAAWAREGVSLRSWISRSLRIAAPGAIGFALGATPHLVAKAIIYGNPLELGYDGLGWSLAEWLPQTLLSSQRGLWVWHPIYLLACLGFVPLVRRHPALGWRCIAAFGAAALAVSSKPNWHGGSAFGNRYLLIMLPIFLVSLAALLEASRVWLLGHLGARRWPPEHLIVAVLAALSLWNAGLLLQWGLNLIPNRGEVSFAAVAKNQVTAVPAKFGAVLLPFLFERSDVVNTVEREDLEEIDTFQNRGSICTPPAR